jgi:hypothetical protein
MVALIGAGVIDFSFLEHQTFPLAEVNEALSAAGDRPGGFSNVVVLLDEHQKAVSLFHLDMLSFEERVLSQTDPGVVLFFSAEALIPIQHQLRLRQPLHNPSTSLLSFSFLLSTLVILRFLPVAVDLLMLRLAGLGT